MKKKFLALALAVAVMAPTTSAFAQTQTIQGIDSGNYDANVTISGTVSRSNGTVPDGRIEVEMPTRATFAVDQEGRFTGSDFTVNNRSSVAVNLSVASFSEKIQNGGINIDKSLTPQNAADKGRNTVKLQLEATSGGQSNSIDLDSTVNNESLVDIESGNTATVQILGLAGTKKEDNQEVENGGASEEFTVTFKIKKA